MDHMNRGDRDFYVDLESGGASCEDVGSTYPVLGTKISNTLTNIFGGLVSIDGSIKGKKETILSGNISEVSGIALENGKFLIDKKVEGDEAVDLVEVKSGKERRKTSGKKPPRPPRPPKALSLDAADQKLIKEISELALVKRARIERMKALKKMKVEKASTSTGNLFAMMFTIIFCLIVIFQVMSPGRGSPVSFQGSPESTQAANSGFISVGYHQNTSASDAINFGSGSPILAELVFGSDPVQR